MSKFLNIIVNIQYAGSQQYCSFVDLYSVVGVGREDWIHKEVDWFTYIYLLIIKMVSEFDIGIIHWQTFDWESY